MIEKIYLTDSRYGKRERKEVGRNILGRKGLYRVSDTGINRKRFNHNQEFGSFNTSILIFQSLESATIK